MKSENAMEPHVRKTLETIDNEIKERQGYLGQLIGLRTGLMDLYGLPPSLPMGNLKSVQTPVPPGAPKKGKRKYQKRASTKGGGDATAHAGDVSAAYREFMGEAPAVSDKWVPRAGTLPDRLLGVIRTAVEPFTAQSLTVACAGAGVETNAKLVGTELWKLFNAGYVKEAGKEGLMKLYKRA